MSPTIAETVVAISREVLADPSITLASTSATVPTWDSLGHMNLIAVLEAHFAVELDVMEMAEVDSVEALVRVVEDAIAAAPGLLRSGS